jgi:hypothetical protein
MHASSSSGFGSSSTTSDLETALISAPGSSSSVSHLSAASNSNSNNNKSASSNLSNPQQARLGVQPHHSHFRRSTDSRPPSLKYTSEPDQPFTVHELKRRLMWFLPLLNMILFIVDVTDNVYTARDALYIVMFVLTSALQATVLLKYHISLRYLVATACFTAHVFAKFLTLIAVTLIILVTEFSSMQQYFFYSLYNSGIVLTMLWTVISFDSHHMVQRKHRHVVFPLYIHIVFSLVYDLVKYYIRVLVPLSRLNTQQLALATAALTASMSFKYDCLKIVSEKIKRPRYSYLWSETIPENVDDRGRPWLVYRV